MQRGTASLNAFGRPLANLRLWPMPCSGESGKARTYTYETLSIARTSNDDPHPYRLDLF